MRLARSSTSVDARWIAEPAVCSDRDPRVPDAAAHGLGVGVDQRDLVHRDAQDLRCKHRERGVMSLAVRAGAGVHGGRAVVVDLARAVLQVQTHGSGHLDVGRDADTELLRFTEPHVDVSCSARRSP